ncbi:MAG: hypothetical protein IPK01_01060 [Acidobacteria bacterium]|nr:hypothetical protein [Acidobacteriota bacterium]
MTGAGASLLLRALDGLESVNLSSHRYSRPQLPTCRDIAFGGPRALASVTLVRAMSA